VQGCGNDTDVEVQMRCGTVDDRDARKPRDEESMSQTTSQRSERSRTPATVAEPDSTMSNEAGDQTIPTDVDPTEGCAMVDSIRDEWSGTETGRQNDEDADVMSNNSNDATYVNGRTYRDTFHLERLLAFEATRTRNRSETAVKFDMKHSDSMSHFEPGSSELMGQSSVVISRKRPYTDSELDVDQFSSIQTTSSAQIVDIPPLEGTRKKHRPDPLVLAPALVEHYGYPSWLRSPRVWHTSGPIPYTPPPMLSPARRAPGLFWAASGTQNQPPWSSQFRRPSAFACKSGISAIRRVGISARKI